MVINLVSYKTEEDREEIISLLKEKYKDNYNLKFRKISDTLILPDKKWIICPESLIKILTKRKENINIYTTEVVKNALFKDKTFRHS